MKLKCETHDRRLMILEGSGKWVHRTGDQSDCDSKVASIGEETIRRGQRPAPLYTPPAEKLLHEIFGEAPLSSE